MKKTLLLSALFSSFLLQPSITRGQLALDPSYSSDGLYVKDFGSNDNLTAIAVQPNDQKIVAVGTAINGSTFGGRLLVLRTMPNGSADQTFANNGALVIEDYQESYAYAIEILSDGKMMIAGAVANAQYQFSMAVIRLDADGNFDASFGVDGISLIDLTPTDEFAYAMAIQSDGKIVLAGSAGDDQYRNMPAVVRLNEDGSVDETFGDMGISFIPVTEVDNDFSSVLVQADGIIVASGHWDQGLTDAGWQDFDVLVAQFDENGFLNSGFGNGGMVTTAISIEKAEEAYGMQLTDGDVLVSGYTLATDQTYDIFLCKYKSNGDLVETFGDAGIVILDQSTGDVAYDMLLQNNSILLAGAVGDGFDDLDLLLAAFNSDGTVDATFGTNGIVRADVAGGFDEANGMAFQADGKVVLAGKGRGDLNNDAVIARLADDVTVGIAQSNSSSEYAVYPNPTVAGQYITIQGNFESNVTVQLFDLQSRAISGTSITTKSVDRIGFNLPTTLAEGTYLLQVNTSKNGSSTIRITVAN